MLHRPLLVLLATLLLIAAPGLLLAQSVLSVPSDHATIQGAITAASDGDIVRVAPGTYLENLEFGGKAIAVESIAGPGATTIDGSVLTLGSSRGSVVHFDANETNASRLTGFTLRGGQGARVSTTHNNIVGGGLYVSQAAPTVTDCVIEENHAETGGGVYWHMADGGLFQRCIVRNNTCSFTREAGMSVRGFGSLQILDCEFLGNHAVAGASICGALHVNGDVVTIARSKFNASNTFATITVGTGATPGIAPIGVTGNTLLKDCLLADCNTAYSVLLCTQDCTVRDCHILDNVAPSILNAVADVTLERTVIARNDSSTYLLSTSLSAPGFGAAVALDFIQCTIEDNLSGVHLLRLLSPTTATFDSCIIRNSGTSVLPGSGVTVRHSNTDVPALHAGAQNSFDADPLYVDACGNDFRLLPGSPCVNTGAPRLPLDPDGSVADVGAFALAPSFRRGDVDGNGIVAITDMVQLARHAAGVELLDCARAGDIDDDQAVTLSDAVLVGSYLSLGGAPPQAPFPGCSLAPPDDLVVATTLPCNITSSSCP